MPLFRLLHCSDLHLSPVAYCFGIPDFLASVAQGQLGRPSAVSTCDIDVVDAMASFSYQYRDCYDVMVLSGDLAATGRTEDLKEVRLLLQTPPVNGHLGADDQPTVRGAKKVVSIPGNHDRFGPMVNLPPFAPGDVTFDATLGEHWSVGQSAQELWAGTKGNVTLVLVGVDFTLSPGDLGVGPFGYLGQGRATRSRVETLCRITQNARRSHVGAVVVWVLHFEPMIESEVLRLLDEEDDFHSAVQREQIPLILCGHSHQQRTKRIRDATVYVCGTTTQYYAPDGNHLALIEVDVPDGQPNSPEIRQRPFRFDRDQKQFVPISAALRA